MGVSSTGGGGEITAALLACRDGSREALERVFSLVYDDLRRFAHHQLRGSRPGQTLNTTGLVHEAYLKLVRHEGASWKDRAHFYAVASRAMRQIVIDFARKKARLKRGGDLRREPLDDKAAAVEQRAAEMIALDEALGGLAKVDPRLIKVVECRFFGGLSEAETAEALGVSERTVQRDWQRARGWLRREMGRP